MKASETSLQPIISRPEQQYIVPLFQRSYSWDKKEWQELWNDLLDLLESSSENDKLKTHFLGSIVTIPIEHTPQSIAKYSLIDGQQRLTTLFILFILIRDITENEQLKEKIQEQQLINKYAKGDDRYKLLPTQEDRPVFESLIENQIITSELKTTLMVRCYEFFSKKISKVDEEVLANIISNQLTVVSIVLQADENPYLIFESLNARGKPLTQADLIRNYFFMRIPNNADQISNFKQYWQPMQEALGDDLTECIRHYLIAIKMSFINKSEVYVTLKNWIENSKKDILLSLQEMATYADYYKKILYPEYESVLSIQQALERIKRIETTVIYPFLLRIYHDYVEKKLTEADLVKVLQLIENLVIRRSICNIPSNSLNKLFASAYREIQWNNSQEFVSAITTFLQQKGNLPNDEEFKTNLLETKIYRRERERAKLILESLESSYKHKEAVDFKNLSIEHVMPQKLNSWWKTHLGEEFSTTHDLYLHTLGNLTLTGYNSELSNKSFPEKQKALAKSHLELNCYFADKMEWREAQIQARAEHLANLALKVWLYFGTEKPVITKNRTVTGTRPSRFIFNNQEIEIKKTWRSVLEQVLNVIIDDQPEIFAALLTEYPNFLSRDQNTFRRCAQLQQNYYVEINCSAEHIYRFCQQVMEYCGYSTEDWQIEYQ